ncbi:hypothetical protein HMPREF0731_4683, partial [Pseudoroseomonas cervicalis ATCC 49957]
AAPIAAPRQFCPIAPPSSAPPTAPSAAPFRMSSAKKLPVLSRATSCARQESEPSSAPIRPSRVSGVAQPASRPREVTRATARRAWTGMAGIPCAVGGRTLKAVLVHCQAMHGASSRLRLRSLDHVTGCCARSVAGVAEAHQFHRRGDHIRFSAALHSRPPPVTRR